MDIRSLTPTICRLMGIEPPTICQAAPLELVLALGPALVEHVLVYAPDAIGRHFLEANPALLARLRAAATVEVSLRSMVPPKTPVCFASMFTGALPEAHGIRKYERPVLACDTLFDALARAGRRVAIAAVRGCSMDIIFRNRLIDYFTEEDDAGVTQRTLGLLSLREHDFIVAYHLEYDDPLHKARHDDAAAVAAARRHVDTFVRLAEAAAEHWPDASHLLVFAPDHGAHFDAAKGKSDHGEDITEDMELLHFWRLVDTPARHRV